MAVRASEEGLEGAAFPGLMWLLMDSQNPGTQRFSRLLYGVLENCV